MKKILRHSQGNIWASVEITFENGRLSICGSMGEVLTMKEAKKQALEYWKSYFDDMPSEIIDMNKRCGSKCHNSLQAAKFVVATDGALHGLDVNHIEHGMVYLTNSYGQCIDSIARELPTFPNIEKIVNIWENWHLNDMKTGMPQQEQFLKDYKAQRKLDYLSYDEATSILAKHGLLTVEDVGGKKYKYGSAWLKETVPSEVLKEIEKL